MISKGDAQKNIARKAYRPDDSIRDNDIAECVTPEWSEVPGIAAFTTTRAGGVSCTPYDSCNLGLHVNDDRLAVEQNRRQLLQRFSLPVQPVWLNQTHSTRIITLRDGAQQSKDADGSFTSEPDVVLAVLTADCLPVVIRDAKCTQLAVLHAGWRGLAAGILSEAVQKFTQGSQLHAWLGPAIGAGKFEVGEDVYSAFVDPEPANAKHFRDTAKRGKFLADLYGVARDELQGLGCDNVGGAKHCTYSENELFYSHRRDGVASGRMATVAWLMR